MKRKRFLKKSAVLKITTNRREYHILYDHQIHIDCCIICSRRRGYWCDCWNNGEHNYDNPLKSWKYQFKKENSGCLLNLKDKTFSYLINIIYNIE